MPILVDYRQCSVLILKLNFKKVIFRKYAEV